MSAKRNTSRGIVLAVILSLAVFLLDLHTPHSWSDWLLYLVPLLLLAPLLERRSLYLVTAAYTGLLVLGLFSSPAGVVSFWMAALNRTMGALVLWFTVLLFTRRKRADDALRRSEQEYRSLVENLNDVVYRMDAQGNLTYVSPTIARASGYTPDEITQQFFGQLIYPDDIPTLQAGLARTLAGEPQPYEFRVFDKDRAVRWVRVSSRPQFDGDQLIGFTGVITDVSERKHAEQAFQQEAEVSQALVRVGRELISSLDRPALLERLCQVTVDVLGADYTHTSLFETRSGTYTFAAGHGYSREESESLRALRIPQAMVASFIARLEREEVVRLPGSDVVCRLFQGSGSEVEAGYGLFIALRRGTDVIGIQSVYRRAQRGEFGLQQVRVAQGVKQIASLVLEHARTLAELEGANRLKSDFVATMSHELRTPLSVIIGYTDLLLEGAFGGVTTEQQGSLRTVLKSAQELLELINATLDLGRLERGRTPLAVREVPLAELMDEVRRDTRGLPARPDLRVVWNVAADLRSISTDSLKVKVIVKNLIVNAVKFTERGTVTVSAHNVNGGVEIAVADTGIGIDAQALPIVFEPFRQADSSMTRRYGGVGLGLYIVRQFLDMLGGRIAVESEVGHGSTFRVWLPPSITPP